MKKEDFLKTYSSLSNTDLLKIMEEKNNYQPVAVEAAQQILSERNYSHEELIIARSELDFIKNSKKEKQEKINKKISVINDVIDENFGLKERSAKKVFNLFCLVIFLIYLISGFYSIKIFAFLFTSKIIGYTAGVLAYLLELIIIYSLYKRNNWAWVIFVCINLYLGLQDVSLFIDFYKHNNYFFAPPNPYNSLFNLVFHTAVILFLNSKKIAGQFTITKDGRITTLIISGLLFIFLIFIL